ncbi:class I adenylate-forming enzyme family protein [Salinispora oceanensis]|uniref:class I adenylate-forming enzyme family protein n=1 Tax=Salinispora oceanensis TaxID=1050199 RepID=UPI00037850E9|nr:class I adenylate-forming enzyme family protein [Salinispora oceanensis]
MSGETGSWWGAHLLARGPATAVWARTPEKLTLGHLRSGIAGVADSLASQGIGPGSTVALNMPQGLTAVYALLAVWALGAQAILIDHRSAGAEVERILGLCRAQFLVRAQEVPKKASAVLADEHAIRIDRRGSGSPAEDDVCLVQFSSGSMGVPKAIGRSPASLLAEIDRYANLEGMPGPSERLVLLNSLFHTMGLVGGLLHGLNTGVELVFPTRVNPEAVVQAAIQARAQAIFGVPVHFDLISRMRHDALPALRLAVSAGEILPPEVYDRFADTFTTTVRPVYGTTETGLIAADLTRDCRPPCVGRPVHDMRVKTNDGQVLVALERNPYLYLDQPGRYERGWLRTFDRGQLEPESGHLSILGRADAVVVIGGLKVDLGEVEAVLRQHPEVRETVVVFDRSIEAYVGADRSLTADDLADWCRDRLSDYKIPRLFHLAAAVPRNPNGKIIRSPELLRAAYRSIHN